MRGHVITHQKRITDVKRELRMNGMEPGITIQRVHRKEHVNVNISVNMDLQLKIRIDNGKVDIHTYVDIDISYTCIII